MTVPPCVEETCSIEADVVDSKLQLDVKLADASIECSGDAGLKIKLDTVDPDNQLLSLAAGGLRASRPIAHGYLQYEGSAIQFPEDGNPHQSSALTIANTSGRDLLAIITTRWEMRYYIDTGGEYETGGSFYLNFDAAAAAPWVVTEDFSLYGPSLTAAVAGSGNVRVLKHNKTHIDTLPDGATYILAGGGTARSGNGNVHVTADGGLDDFFKVSHSLLLVDLDVIGGLTGLATITP